jgi:meso-butanediol dehydrogenase/(S,S)-butanediol dehydrogenase/diacetyl reductase
VRSTASIPLRRPGDPEEEIGRVVAFLCGPAAGHITGTTIAVDGGQAHLR